VEMMEFARLHIFRYSRRAGTTAASMPGQVPSTLSQARSRRMHALGAQLERSFQNRFLGRTLPVLWEHCEELGDGKRWSGLTDNYLRVVIDTCANVDLQNSVLEAQLVEALPGMMVGDIPGLRQGREGAMTMLQSPGVGTQIGADAR
ncbi:MAG: hypothetical protein ACE5FI_10365, partial [Anaerolineales bacterium]